MKFEPFASAAVVTFAGPDGRGYDLPVVGYFISAEDDRKRLIRAAVSTEDGRVYPCLEVPASYGLTFRSIREGLVSYGGL